MLRKIPSFEGGRVRTAGEGAEKIVDTIDTSALSERLSRRYAGVCFREVSKLYEKLEELRFRYLLLEEEVGPSCDSRVTRTTTRCAAIFSI